jgi:hypothetical protein
VKTARHRIATEGISAGGDHALTRLPRLTLDGRRSTVQMVEGSVKDRSIGTFRQRRWLDCGGHVMKEGTVFYSWQSDIPSTRNFIERALEQAIKELNKGKVLRVEARKDKALQGAAGAVRIDEDILERIDACELFVGDVTLVTSPDSRDRRSPNPCVLIELGYARKHLGWERMILPFNSHYGDKRDLPFDLDKNRLALFEYDETADDEARAASKRDLITVFKDAILAILALPTLKDTVKRFLDETNPAILNLVRTGVCVVSINIASHRLSELSDLQQNSGLNEFVEIRSTGSIAMAGGSIPGINDVRSLGALHGFAFGFKGDPSSW